MTSGENSLRKSPKTVAFYVVRTIGGGGGGTWEDGNL